MNEPQEKRRELKRNTKKGYRKLLERFNSDKFVGACGHNIVFLCRDNISGWVRYILHCDIEVYGTMRDNNETHLLAMSSSRQAELDGKKEHRPGERVKQMTIVVDTALSEHAGFMAAFTPRVQEMGVGYCVCAHPEPGSVHWVRKVTERTVDDRAQVSHLWREAERVLHTAPLLAQQL